MRHQFQIERPLGTMQVFYLSLSKAIAQCTYSWQKTVRADANALSLCVRRCSLETDKLWSEKAATRPRGLYLFLTVVYGDKREGRGGLDANRFHRNIELIFSSTATRKGSRPKDYLAKKKLNFRVEQQSVCKVNIWPNTRMFQHAHNLRINGSLGSEPDSLQLLYTHKIEPCSRNTNHEDFLHIFYESFFCRERQDGKP